MLEYLVRADGARRGAKYAEGVRSRAHPPPLVAQLKKNIYIAHKSLLCWISPSITFDPTVSLVLCFSTENGVNVRPYGQSCTLF